MASKQSAAVRAMYERWTVDRLNGRPMDPESWGDLSVIPEGQIGKLVLEDGGIDTGSVGDTHRVVAFEARPQVVEDRARLLDRGFIHVHRAEAAREQASELGHKLAALRAERDSIRRRIEELSERQRTLAADQAREDRLREDAKNAIERLDEELAAIDEWRKLILTVAREEMGHIATLRRDGHCVTQAGDAPAEPWDLALLECHLLIMASSIDGTVLASEPAKWNENSAVLSSGLPITNPPSGVVLTILVQSPFGA